VAANRDSQAKELDGESADYECGAHDGIGEQNEGGDGEKETGRHHQQSRIFHGLPLEIWWPRTSTVRRNLNFIVMDDRPADPDVMNRGLHSGKFLGLRAIGCGAFYAF